MIILVTGSNGFIGKHLVEALLRRPETEVIGYDVGTPADVLEKGLREADVVFHLAGVNRPKNVEEFKEGNADFTQSICSRLLELGRTPMLVISSSIQAALDNPYGVSKLGAEQAIEDYAKKCSSLKPFNQNSRPQAVIFRLKNVFGKWCRPNYNSVTATFCHNIAHDLPISISDPSRALELVYIDDVIAAFVSTLELKSSSSPCERREVQKFFTVTLGSLSDLILSFRQSRKTLLLPQMDDEFTRNLYATYLSYLDGPDFAYCLDQKTDPRGSLAEFVKSPGIGQIFVSRTKPGITRGNHYHHTKVEKFLVVEGDAIIRFRHINGGAIIEHRVSGHEYKVVDIPPGYTHSIENVGTTEMVCLFWASEIFDPGKPDTCFLKVLE